MNENEKQYYDVVGAGKIEIGKQANCCCGCRAGFSFGVEWTNDEYCGGVLSREEARKLADHIYKVLDACTDTEEECYEKACNEEKFEEDELFNQEN